MKYTWNSTKRLVNLEKHGLDFADAESFITVGLLGDRVVVIAHTKSDNEIHVIFMRKAERHEREKFFARIDRRSRRSA